jgi:hypothetical protein
MVSSGLFRRVALVRATWRNNPEDTILQDGFRPNSFTEKASFKIIEEILKAINNKQFVGGGDIL